MEKEIYSDRIKLSRLLTNEIGSSDLEDYMKIWSDPQAAGWSLHAKDCQTVEGCQKWLSALLPAPTGDDGTKIGYTVYSMASDTHNKINWKAIGQVSLLFQEPWSLDTLYKNDLKFDETLPAQTFVIGYLFLSEEWGKGYATESCRLMLDAFKQVHSGSNLHIEAGVDHENMGSRRVLQKLGFQAVGVKKWEGQVFLQGRWRDSEIVVYKRAL